MGGRRLGRREPKQRHVALQDRDLHVFRMLLKARVLTTGDFVPLLFPSLPVARRRLSKLVAGRYIAGYVPALHEETQYVLNRHGQIALAEADGVAITPRSAPRRLKGPGEHHLMLVRFWSRLVAECHAHPTVELIRFSFEWEVGEPGIATTTRFRPDAVVVIDDGERELGFLVEIDRGTEAPSYVARHKFSVFERLWATATPMYGERLAGLLVVVPRQRRLRSLARALGNGHAPIFGTTFDRMDPPVLLEPAWERLADLLGEPQLAVRLDELGQVS